MPMNSTKHSMASRSINKPSFIQTAIPWLLAVGLTVLSVLTGRYCLSWQEVLKGSGLDYQVFIQLRLGRTGTVILSGIALGVAGQVFQIVFRNPLAAPDTAGVASGASAGAALSILLFSGVSGVTPLFSFAGGMIAVLTVILLQTFTRRIGVGSLVICGICVNALFQALLAYMKTAADQDHIIASIEFWLMGSFSGATLDTLWKMLPWVTVSLLGIGLIHRPIRLLAFEDDEAIMLGVPVLCTRVAALVLATMAVSAVISQTGLVSFIGLLAPHIARQLSQGKKKPFFFSALSGAVLLLGADILSRSIASAEIPISVLTSLLGVPTLFLLLFRRNRHEAT